MEIIETLRKISISLVCYLLFLLLWENDWEKQFKEGRNYFGPQFEDAIHDDRDVVSMVAKV